MNKLLILAIAASLSACGDRVPINLCKYAEARRTVYTTTIAAANAYVASGRPAPAELLLGRQAAVTALAMLDARCPATDAPTAQAS